MAQGIRKEGNTAPVPLTMPDIAGIWTRAKSNLSEGYMI
jgi:hypothetical protein